MYYTSVRLRKLHPSFLVKTKLKNHVSVISIIMSVWLLNWIIATWLLHFLLHKIILQCVFLLLLLYFSKFSPLWSRVLAWVRKRYRANWKTKVKSEHSPSSCYRVFCMGHHSMSGLCIIIFTPEIFPYRNWCCDHTDNHLILK